MSPSPFSPNRARTGPTPGRRGRRLALWGALTLIPVLTAATFWAVGRSNQRVPPAEARAVDEALADDRVPEARASAEAWTRRSPDSPDAWFALARVEYRAKRLNEAFDAIKRARSLGHPADALDRLLGLVYAQAGRSAEAEPILMKVLDAADGRDLEVAEALARSFLNTYKLPLAEIVLKRWIEVAPEAAKPHLWYTEIDKRTEVDPSVTIGHFLAALEREPGLDAARLGLAEALLAAKRSAEAAKVFDEYIARRPDDPAGHIGAALAAREIRDDEAVTRHLAAALKLAPDNPAALRESAALAMRKGDAAAALAAADRAVKSDPRDSEILYLRSLALARLGRTAEAKEAQQQSETLRRDVAELLDVQAKLVKDPTNIAYRCKIARWMFDHDQPYEAARWARSILEQSPNDLDMKALLADYHEKRGDAGLANFYRMQAGAKK